MDKSNELFIIKKLKTGSKDYSQTLPNASYFIIIKTKIKHITYIFFKCIQTYEMEKK